MIIITAAWNMSIEDVQKADSADRALVAWVCKGSAALQPSESENTLLGDLSELASCLRSGVTQVLNTNSCQRTSSVLLQVVKLQDTRMGWGWVGHFVFSIGIPR